MLIAAAFCPQPPLLVPGLAAGAAAELDPLRTACDQALRVLAGAGARALRILAGAGAAARYPGGHGNLSRYGVPLEIALPDPSGAELPPALLLGAWLAARSLPGLPATGRTVGPDGALDPDGTLGADDAEGGTEPVGLLVMGDGSARRAERSPGGPDPRGIPYDEGVAAALASGEPDRLRGLDLALAAELMVAGAPAWVAAGALLAAGSGADAVPYDAKVLYDEAPYGVGYFVASWVRR